MSTPLAIDDDYTGDIGTDGAAQRRRIGDAVMIKASVGEMDNNAYLITCSRTGESVLIDAAAEAGTLVQLVDEHAPRLALIVTTHQHPDHWQALADVQTGYECPTAASAVDGAELPLAPDQVIEHGDTVTVGELTFDVIGLRGHTPGSVALALTADGVTHLFIGDSLFPGGPGKTWSPEDFTSLMDDLESRIFGVYGDDTVVYPGHGKDTTLGAERPHLAEWRERGW